MRIWAISDTHGIHDQLVIPENIDLVIHAGDASNYRSVANNLPEMEAFIDWYSALNIPYKIFVAGNHDSSVESGMITKRTFHDHEIIYLENEETIINGLKFFGSPYTPTFGNWCFMKSRHKLHDIWKHIPDDTDILITHGPPQGILDLAEHETLEMCGCASLRSKVFNLTQLKYHIFGHLHRNGNCLNCGTYQHPNFQTTFINASCVTDGKMHYLSSNGIIFEI